MYENLDFDEEYVRNDTIRTVAMNKNASAQPELSKQEFAESVENKSFIFTDDQGSEIMAEQNYDQNDNNAANFDFDDKGTEYKVH